MNQQSTVELLIKAAQPQRVLKAVNAGAEKLKNAVQKTNATFKRFGRQGVEAAKQIKQALLEAEKSAKKLFSSIGGLRGALLSIGGTIAAREILETGVSAIESERKIRLLTQSTGNTAESLAMAERAAKKFGLSAIEANTGVARLLARLQPMGLSLSDIETTFSGFNTAAKLAGATASESAGAFLQLTQALGSGVLRGQELNSILEQAPLIAQAIALEMNVTVGALKKFGEEGAITSSIVIAALKRVDREGAKKLTEAMKGPAQQFKNLGNASVDLSESITDKLLPAILPVVHATTALIKGFVELPEPIKAIVIGTSALTLGALALAPALLLVTKAIVALKLAVLAFPFVAAAAGLVAIGVAAAGAMKEIKRFNEVVDITGNTTKELENETEQVNKEIDKLALSLKRGGHEGRIARKKLDKLNEALDKIEARKDLVIKLKIDVPFPDFATMGPGFKEELDKLLGKETEAEKKARLKREKRGQETAGGMFQQAGRDIQLLTAQTDLGKQLLESDFARADALERINKLEGISAERRQEVVDITNRAFDAQRGSIIGQALSQDVIKAQELAEAQREAVLPLERQKELLEAKLNGNEREVRLRQEVDQIMASTEGLNRQEVENAVNIVAALEDQVAAAQQLENLYVQVGSAIESGIVNGIQSAIDGSKSLGESLSSILKQVGGMFLKAGIGSFGIGGQAGSGLLGLLPFAEGGYVSGPTPAMVGEGGEPEYVIPESKMRESMSRYSRGARGSSVIPEEGGLGTTGGSGGAAVAAPIDVRYNVERINSVDYVTADQFQSGLQSAAAQGAQRGEQNTLKRLQMSGSTRRRLGM